MMQGDSSNVTPWPFHVMAKPIGPICNLNCDYCYYLHTQSFYSDVNFRMHEDLLETYLRQMIESQSTKEVTLAWQGGEPTLLGIAFFQRAIEIAERYRRPDQHLVHTIQTNATLVTDEWAHFFKQYDFLVGISVDGPEEIHDSYRRDKHGQSSWIRVMEGMRHLQNHDVRFNVLCTVHAANADHPLEVYRFFRDTCGVRFIQFIPIVERVDKDVLHSAAISERSVSAEQWGQFLIMVFDEWVCRDVGDVFVQMFDLSLEAWLGLPASMCIFTETCGKAMALEHNGDVYSCDHFVDPAHWLGNITETPLSDLVMLEEQQQFGEAKRDSLPLYCMECDVRFACHGECPKNRLIKTPNGDPGLNYLCDGYKNFFHHVDGSMKQMADLIQQKRSPADIIKIFATTGRNEPCPCGSGRKMKKCHGR